MADLYSNVSLIGHGTTGTDGIPAGNHLRWFFDRRLGFPLGGFRLYRRPAAHTEWRARMCSYEEWREFGKSQIRSAEVNCHDAPSIIFTSEVPFWGAPQDPYDKKTFFVHFEGELKLEFSRQIQFADVECFRKEGPLLALEAHDSKSGQVIDTDVATPNPSRLERVKLSVSGAGFDTLKLKAEAGGFHALTFGWYEPEKYGHGEWVLISGDIPISLPYTHKLYPLRHRHTGEPDGDWLEARRRKAWGAAYDRQDFQEMLDVFGDMFAPPKESLMVRYFDYAAEGGRPQDEGLSLRILPSDLLHLTSLDPVVARILGMAFLDRRAEAGVPYDYRVEGTWTKGNVWLLEDFVTTFDELDLGHTFLPYFALGKLVFRGSNQRVVEQPSTLAGTSHALELGVLAGGEIEIVFPERAGEVQLFVSGDLAGASLAGYIDESKQQSVVPGVRSGEQILHLSDPLGFERVILQGKNIHLHKVCYDPDTLGHPETKEVVYAGYQPGLMVQDAELPAPPAGLAGTTFAGMTLPVGNGASQLRDARLNVGLSWHLEGGPDALVRFLAYREDPDGTRKVLNQGVPVLGSAGPAGLDSGDGNGAATASLLNDRLPGPGRYHYTVRGMDLFGRASDYSSPIAVEAAGDLYLPPPPPIDVRVRFLDEADPGLAAVEREKLASAGISTALTLSWTWSADQAEQNPDVSQFHVHVQPGWLNSYALQVLYAQDNGDATAGVVVQSDALRGVAARQLAGCALQSSGQFYPVQANEAATERGKVGLTVGQPEGIATAAAALDATRAVDPGARALITTRRPLSAYLPQAGAASLSVLPSSPLYVDFGLASKWMYWRLATVAGSGPRDYQLFIPSPPIAATPQEPLAYAQVTVTSDDGRQESVTAPAATTFAVHRVPPPVPARSTSPHTYASFPDIYGRSAYTFVFPQKAPYYEVYRASLETLISVDRAQRQGGRSRSESDYGDFLASYPAEPLRTAIVEQVVEPDAGVISYDDLDNDLLQALASLQGNEGAFGRLHPGKLDASAYTSPTNSGEFAYTDTTLPGLGEGRYFYRARAIDSAENASPLGPATLPICLRDVSPPRPPGVVSVLGGDRQIRVRWKTNRETHLAGYRLYRTSDPASSGDIRLMNLVMDCGPDDHVAEEARQREYADTTVVPRTPYFYRLVAVRHLSYEDGQETEVPSRPSPALRAQAYDGETLAPPVWLSPQELPAGLELAWTSEDAGLTCLVQKKETGPPQAGSPEWISLSGWLDPGDYRYLDASRAPGEAAEYRLKVMDSDGRLNRDYDVLEVGP